MLVKEARQVIVGIEPQQLRDSVRLRQMVARPVCFGLMSRWGQRRIPRMPIASAAR